MLNDRLSRTPISRMTRAAVFGAIALRECRRCGGARWVLESDGFGRGRVWPRRARHCADPAERAAPDEIRGDVRRAGQIRVRGIAPWKLSHRGAGLGFQPVKDTVTLAGQNLQRNITLKVGSLTETITVGFSTSDVAAGDQKPPTIKEVPARARQECVASAAGGQIVPPRKLRDVYPQYPAALRGTGTGGIVVMQARLGVDGYVRDIQIVGDAHPELAQAAIAAVREWAIFGDAAQLRAGGSANHDHDEFPGDDASLT